MQLPRPSLKVLVECYIFLNMKRRFKTFKQLNAMDCGPTCLRMIAQYYGKHYTAASIRNLAGFNRTGVSMLGICDAAESIGLKAIGMKINLEQLLEEAPLPCIIHWDKNHFVVLLSYSLRGKTKIKVADPALGVVHYTVSEFKKHWLSSLNIKGESVGTVLILEPTPEFYKKYSERESRMGWRSILQNFHQSRWDLIRVLFALLLSSIFQMIFPFLMQSIIDIGINGQNLSYITLVLAAQLILIFSRTIVDFIRSRLLLKISININLRILSRFWLKLTRLPLTYFERHHTGDILQRIGDNKSIQAFFTGPALATLFSLFNFFVFSAVLLTYSSSIFLVFSIGSALYFFWIQLFLKVRRKLNYQSFKLAAQENAVTLQLVEGMREIKLNNAEQMKRWNWENMQIGLFKLQFKSLSYSQWQQAGAILINQGKDAIITFLVAQMVVHGTITLGAMLAIQYILGQLSSPVDQIVTFIQALQDAKISLERLNEVHELEEEEKQEASIRNLPEDSSISLEGVSFTYPGNSHDHVINKIDLLIPSGKMTAIVGASGSGKTTLMKLLLKFYDQYQGDIKIGGTPLRYISTSFWRQQCGAILQDGFIFNETIAQNIAVGAEQIDHHRLIQSCKTANILSFIEGLPHGFSTLLGSEGIGISQGQKQRMLIARAIYKNPSFLFLDEATNALDAHNERTIVENLEGFFRGKTVVVIAHRLSTVKNAAKIVVLDKGKICEQGTHQELTRMKGKYFELVKNQLELED